MRPEIEKDLVLAQIEEVVVAGYLRQEGKKHHIDKAKAEQAYQQLYVDVGLMVGFDFVEHLEFGIVIQKPHVRLPGAGYALLHFALHQAILLFPLLSFHLAQVHPR